MPYPESIVSPMRGELTRLGVVELTDASAVDKVFDDWKDDTFVLVVNSVCGCAAANARPAVALAMRSEPRPQNFATVFAGQDIEATKQARTHLPGVPPSSPFIAVFKQGEPVFVLERRHIEGRSASMIASDLVGAFDKYCKTDDVSVTSPDAPAAETDSSLPDSFKSIL